MKITEVREKFKTCKVSMDAYEGARGARERLEKILNLHSLSMAQVLSHLIQQGLAAMPEGGSDEAS